MATCSTCNNQHAYRVRIGYDHWGNRYELCDNCGNLPSPKVHDAYLGEGGVHYEENLADPKTGEPIPFHTKGEKAAIMKRLGVKEAGDRHHGARNETYKRRYYV